MPQPAVAVDIHQPFNIHLHFAAECAFDLILARDDCADLSDFFVRQVADLFAVIDSGAVENIMSACATETKEIGQSDFRPLIFW